MPRTHYKLWCRYNAVDRFLLWYSNDHDGVVDRDGCIPSFRTESALLAYAHTLSVTIEPEAASLHDLDLVQTWLADPHPERVDPPNFLCAWNLFSDVAQTLPVVGARFIELDSLLGPLYDKLFWANNLPAVTPEGERFVPEWSTTEVEELTAVLCEGLSMFTRSLREAG
jgi:hypothetical protein